MDCSQNDVSADPVCRRVHTAKIKTEPIVPRFAIIVYPNAVPVDSYASSLVKIMFQQTYIGQSLANFPIPVVNVELSADDPDAFKNFLISHDPLFHSVIASPG